jgi:hypothetical protein
MRWRLPGPNWDAGRTMAGFGRQNMGMKGRDGGYEEIVRGRMFPFGDCPEWPGHGPAYVAVRARWTASRGGGDVA